MSARSGGHTSGPRTAGARRTAQGVAAGLAALASFAVLVIPSYTGVGSSSNGTETTRTATLLEINGLTALVPVSVPVVLTIVPLVVRDQWSRTASVVATVLLGSFVVLAMLSIGWFFLPALVAAVVALLVPEKHRTGVPSDGRPA